MVVVMVTALVMVAVLIRNNLFICRLDCFICYVCSGGGGNNFSFFMFYLSSIIIDI